jgi:hypothetical protein
VAIHDAPLGDVIRRQLDGHSVTDHAPNFVQHHPPRNRGLNGVAIFQHHITPVAMHRRNDAVDSDAISFAAHDAQA